MKNRVEVVLKGGPRNGESRLLDKDWVKPNHGFNIPRLVSGRFVADTYRFPGSLQEPFFAIYDGDHVDEWEVYNPDLQGLMKKFSKA